MKDEKKGGRKAEAKVRDLGRGKGGNLTEKDLEKVAGGKPLSCGDRGDRCQSLKIITKPGVRTRLDVLLEPGESLP